MRKVTFIGGGSAKFVSTLVQDMFTFPVLQDTRITLMDIDPVRMEPTRQLIQMIIDKQQLPATVECTTDQRASLVDADYVIITVMVGGFDKYYSDTAIPMKYGVLPTVGDTIGPGAVFRLVRTQPVLQQIVDNVREVAPHAWILNYSNPMAMNTMALVEAGHARSVGLCHSIQGTYKQLGRWAGLPEEELDNIRYTAGGINHVNFYLTLTHQGEDLYPKVLANRAEALAKEPHYAASFALLEYLGYFPAECGHHQSEYYPWFRKNEETALQYGAESMWGYNFDMHINVWRAEQIQKALAGEENEEWNRSPEYGARIVHALESNIPLMFYGNVMNNGLIDNLPQWSAVEVPCLADGNGILPCKVGTIPPQLAAVQSAHVYVHQLAVEGVKQRDRTLIRRAIQQDPLTAAICTLPQIQALTDEMFAANEAYITDWPQAMIVR